MNGLRSPYHPLHIVLGLLIWSLWFVAIYGGLSVACAVAPPTPQQGPWNWLNALLGLSAVATLILLGALARWSWRAGLRMHRQPRECFVARLAASTHAVAALATLFIALPILRLPPCL
ncbi:MAG TPA: hypothetical protein VLG17_06770 [Pseudomonas sp.]|uniref:hypothetical protein n=1 Tax=Pseudomonas sp. TaxID=306 RepID=UPI0026308A05|nr:hypothetical protein [Pseudomonas sp.]HSX87688.1 hypothetical protein [Pseudomonas sp.]